MRTNANNIIDDMIKLFEELYKTYEAKDEKRQKEIMDELENIYKENKDNIYIAGNYAIGLGNLTAKQETKEERKETVDKLKEIYEYKENKDNIDVAVGYTLGLSNLTLKQETKEEIKETLETLEGIYKKNKGNEDVSRSYAGGLWNLTLKQEAKEEKIKTIKNLEEMYKNNNYICDIYIVVISELYGKYKENLYNFLNNDKNFVKMILKYVDEKYINVYEENDNLLFCNIMKIWVSVKTILKNLILKELDIKNNRFGQYIGAGTIKYFLKDIEQIKDNGKNINECRYNLLRLDNADYMNDPLEGKAFFKKFEHSDNDFIKDIIDSVNNEYNASSIYLRSLTENIDSLPMWISYGDSAKGCCVIYDNNFFDKDNIGLTTNPEGFYGINTKQILKRQQPDEIQEIDKIQSTAYSYCLYRVIYVEEDGTLKKEETKNVIDDVEKEIEDIKNLIVEIGDKLKNKLKDIILKKKVKEDIILKKNIKNRIIKYITLKEMIKKEMIKKDIITILDEIRYLFKSNDYEHEREVRLLISVPQDSDKIKLDKDRGVIPHIYVEDDRDSRKIIKEVIFGPKVENINEYIPYIKYCDNEVKIEKSKIRYR